MWWWEIISRMKWNFDVNKINEKKRKKTKIIEFVLQSICVKNHVASVLNQMKNKTEKRKKKNFQRTTTMSGENEKDEVNAQVLCVSEIILSIPHICEENPCMNMGMGDGYE